MLKKIIIIIIVAILAFIAFAYVWVFNPFNIGIAPLTRQTARSETEKRLEITFSYNKQRMIASSQYAFWIEDMDGNYIDTIYVTQWTAKGGFSYRPHSIPLWVSVAEPGVMSSGEIDAISGATPSSGDYKLVWNFVDRNGTLLSGTQYRYFIEGTMNNEDNVLFSGTISIGEEAWEDFPAPEFSIPDSEYKGMITNVKVAFFPE